MEMIDRTALLNEIYHGKDKPTIYDRADFADWILECIQKAPEIKDSDNAEKFAPEQIQAGMIVYVLTKHTIQKLDISRGNSSDSKAESFMDIAKCTITKVTKKAGMKYLVSGHFTDGDFYQSTMTEKSIGKKLFLNENEARKRLKK